MEGTDGKGENGKIARNDFLPSPAANVIKPRAKRSCPVAYQFGTATETLR